MKVNLLELEPCLKINFKRSVQSFLDRPNVAESTLCFKDPIAGAKFGQPGLPTAKRSQIQIRLPVTLSIFACWYFLFIFQKHS